MRSGYGKWEDTLSLPNEVMLIQYNAIVNIMTMYGSDRVLQPKKANEYRNACACNMIMA